MIKFENIHLTFDNKIILRNLNLQVNRGDKVVVSGKSGCGKSSLLLLALGFLKPDKGQVFFDEIPVNKNTAWSIRKRISYVDQDVSLGSGRVQELLDFISKLKVNTHLDFNVDDLLCIFELPPGILRKNIKDLSGGERQRLAIVITLLLKRDVFLLDEITSSLDSQLKKKVTDCFLDNKNCTCLIVSHDPVWTDNPAVKVYDFEGEVWVQ